MLLCIILLRRKNKRKSKTKLKVSCYFSFYYNRLSEICKRFYEVIRAIIFAERIFGQFVFLRGTSTLADEYN